VREAIDATSRAKECKSDAASHQREETEADAAQVNSIGESMQVVRGEGELADEAKPGECGFRWLQKGGWSRM
jgi:hypothetical protein